MTLVSIEMAGTRPGSPESTKFPKLLDGAEETQDLEFYESTENDTLGSLIHWASPWYPF